MVRHASVLHASHAPPHMATQHGSQRITSLPSSLHEAYGSFMSQEAAFEQAVLAWRLCKALPEQFGRRSNDDCQVTACFGSPLGR